jgi:hypothetical protein
VGFPMKQSALPGGLQYVFIEHRFAYQKLVSILYKFGSQHNNLPCRDMRRLCSSTSSCVQLLRHCDMLYLRTPSTSSTQPKLHAMCLAPKIYLHCFACGAGLAWPQISTHAPQKHKCAGPAWQVDC